MTGIDRRTPASAASTPRIALRATVTFTVLALGLAWLVALPLWLDGGLANPLAGALLQLMMFTPALAAVIVMLVLKPAPKGERLRLLGIWPLRPAKRVVGMMVLGLFGPVVLVAASVAVAALCGWVQLDLVDFSGFVSSLPVPLTDGVPPVAIVASQLIAIPFAAATINAVLAFGEELGWRGFLVPALTRFGTWPALLVSGAVWGLWHAPIVLLGYNFGRTDVTGPLLMIGGGIAWGVLLGWLRLRSASLWPAVFAHGALNACGAMVVLVHQAGMPLDMALAGPLGVAGWIVCAIVIVALVLAGQFRRRPALADRLADRRVGVTGVGRAEGEG